jgi:hypothetical protein
MGAWESVGWECGMGWWERGSGWERGWEWDRGWTENRIIDSLMEYNGKSFIPFHCHKLKKNPCVNIIQNPTMDWNGKWFFVIN